MKVLIFKTAQEAVDHSAAAVLEQIRERAETVLGLSTGGTMVPVYEKMRATAAGLSFNKVVTFNLDEYLGLCPGDPGSYHSYMRHHLFDHLDFNPHNLHLPSGTAACATQEAERYEMAIKAAGGLDLAILGLGENGHIGFNEPGVSLGSRTHVQALTDQTRAANARYFGTSEQVPRFAITMGVKTIFDARKLIVLATGAHKAAAVQAMRDGPVRTACPASALQAHSQVTLVLDEAAASLFEARAAYADIQGHKVASGHG